MILIESLFNEIDVSGYYNQIEAIPYYKMVDQYGNDSYMITLCKDKKYFFMTSLSLSV